MDGARVAGAAMRPRERSWAKHVRMTVAMALAENLHHSRQKVEGSEPLVRGWVSLRNPSRRWAVTVGSLLVVASLASGDGVDATTVSYLLSVALAKKKEEEEEEEKERKRKEVLARVQERVREGLPLSSAEEGCLAAMDLPPSEAGEEEEEEEEEEPQTSQVLFLRLSTSL